MSYRIDAVGMFSVRAFSAYQIYDKADNIITAITLVGTVASGGSVSIAQLAGLAIDFVPFGKVLHRLEAAGEMTFKARRLLQQIYKASGKKAEMLGDMGALMAIRMKKFKSIGFVPAAKGFDDIVEDAAGNLIIVEAKGGTSALGKVVSGNQQMSQGWIREKIKELREGGAEALADRLEAQAKAGTLKGMVVKTKAVGANAFVPQIEIKEWSQIGATTWK